MSSSANALTFVHDEPDGSSTLNLLVDGMHCPSCVAIIESALRKQPDISIARLNLSTKRLRIVWKGAKELGNQWISLINSMGYRAVPFDPETSESQEQREEKFLLRCMAVAGFASGNMMLFSVPIWSSDTIAMGTATRTMFYWVQALIAIPAIAYCGLPFYRSAWRALKEWRTNMDVPISVAVILATLMSLFELITHGRHAYFDSSVMLLFFLLIGRYLDARARGKARSAAHDLLQMMTGFATKIKSDGTQEIIPLSDIVPGMTLLVAAGEKIGADCEVIEGDSEVDTSLITGETMPHKVGVGAKVFAGTINIASSLKLSVVKAGEHSMLAEIVRLMETAEQGQARYVTVADKISGWYTPAVHALAAATFGGWLYMGAPWQEALLYAATVLIITCPCALGLAVPVVQVLASGKLMRKGILLKSGSALERLVSITHVAFDKTGTLTLGKPALLHADAYEESVLQLAASMAAHSKHPLSQALAAAYNKALLPLNVEEVKGCGLTSNYLGKPMMLGKREWCAANTPASQDSVMELWFAYSNSPAVRFCFDDPPKADAQEIISQLNAAGLKTLLLSGDRPEVVSRVAAQLSITNAKGSLMPMDKCAILEALKNSGASVLMVGDGLNDAPSLATASVSMSPSSAMDITQNAADIVFQGDKLSPVIAAWQVAKFSQKLVKENFILAIGYNIIAIPMAVAGYVTPLVAAIAMSSSSILVIANALRLNLNKS